MKHTNFYVKFFMLIIEINILNIFDMLTIRAERFKLWISLLETWQNSLISYTWFSKQQNKNKISYPQFEPKGLVAKEKTTEILMDRGNHCVTDVAYWAY